MYCHPFYTCIGIAWSFLPLLELASGFYDCIQFLLDILCLHKFHKFHATIYLPRHNPCPLSDEIQSKLGGSFLHCIFSIHLHCLMLILRAMSSCSHSVLALIRWDDSVYTLSLATYSFLNLDSVTPLIITVIDPHPPLCVQWCITV